ncbi:MAG: helix-turn-helix domain-containing protein [Ruminococcaceae bacterium]|nr:helix-turn-helix domain-containing protein [Oscillospiraceae bacterium]
MPQTIDTPIPDFYIEKAVGKATMPHMHDHRAYELYYLCRGEREYFIGDQFYKIGEGDTVLIPPDLLHRTAGKGATRFLLYFSEDFLRRFFTDEMLSALPLESPLVFRPSETLRSDIEEELGAMLTEYADGAEHFSASRLCRLLLIIANTPNGYTSTPFPDQRIGQIVRYINEHYSEISDIEQIADRFFISKYHLCRTFNKNLGLPLISYLNTIKIRAAAELMQNEKLNLTEIATRSGFNSSSYFCKVFKAEKGVAPTIYRKNLQSK